MMITKPPIVTEADLLAYVDGRLASERRGEIEDHLARCPQDAGRVAADLALQEGLRLLFGRPASPPVPLRRGRHASWLARVAMAAGLAVGGYAVGISAAQLEAAPQKAAPGTSVAGTAAIGMK
jgi:anti-sigma factor RsiW